MGGCGYVGSALVPHLSSSGHDLTVVDLLERGNPSGMPCLQREYSSLDADFLQAFDVLVLLAGHSSVGACSQDESGAIQNNVVGLQRILSNIGETPLVYASSGSVYDGTRSSLATEFDAISPARNMYDLTKVVGDQIAALSKKQYFALRFGTVSGFAPNLRPELLINKMSRDGFLHGAVSVANPIANRAVLGIGDLCSAIESVVRLPDSEPGVYNICSENVTMLEAAERIACVTDAEIVALPDSPTYDFSMSVDRFSREFGWAPSETIETLCLGLAPSAGNP